MMGTRIEDIADPRLKAMLLAKLAGERKTTPAPATATERRPTNETECEAARVLTSLGLTVGDYQHAVKIGAHTYTADMLAVGRDDRRYVVEVKGEYSHASRGRSRLAFELALQATGMQGIWMEKRKPGRGKAAHWRIEVYQ